MASPIRRVLSVHVAFALATLALILPFVVFAARDPSLVASRSAMAEAQFGQASTLQTLRLYLEKLRAAQEGLWLEKTRTSQRTYSTARRWFEQHLQSVAWWNRQLAGSLRLMYRGYVGDTAQALRSAPARPPARLSRDYAQFEQRLFSLTAQAYDRAYTSQDGYLAFKDRSQHLMLAFSIVVALATVVLLALSQLYRIRWQRSAEERITFLAEAAAKDFLTGLRNLRAFDEDLPKAAAIAQRNNHPISLIVFDLDGFKETNDRFGHAVGDTFLKYVAGRLNGLREGDGVYRLGGDEFAIVLAGTPAAGAEVVARRLRTPVANEGRLVTLSAGIAELRPGEPLSDWRERADIALYEAKRRGGDTAVLYASIEEQSHFVGAQAASRIRELLECGEMETAFQPIWNRSVSEIVAFEALARPPQRYGFTGPQEAFDAAQRIGRIVELDYLCMQSALRAARDHHLPAHIFLNVTPATLEHPLFEAASIETLLAEYDIASQRVVIEITERTIKDLPALVRSAEKLRQLGVRIALDDAGTGSTGLTLLSSLTCDFVKIDRSLLTEGQAPKGRAVLAGVLAIADAMGSCLIAEGIETQEQLRFAAGLHRVPRTRSLGVQGFQGFLFGAPQILAPSCNAETVFGIHGDAMSAAQ